MIAGHFGLAAAVKAGRPAIPVWTLMLATAWLDVVFVPLYLSGIETVDGAGYGGGVIHADYTHSLVGALVLAALFGAVAAALARPRSCDTGLRPRPGAPPPGTPEKKPGSSSPASSSRTGCSTSSCTAPTCRSCPATPATCPRSASGSGGCPPSRPSSNC